MRSSPVDQKTARTVLKPSADAKVEMRTMQSRGADDVDLFDTLTGRVLPLSKRSSSRGAPRPRHRPGERMKTLLVALSLIAWWSIAAAQDVEYIRAVERAQQARPATIPQSARIAPAGEPGTQMVLHGKVVNAEGAPAAGVIVFAYQTDASGLYDRPEAGAHSWRLKGWAQTDSAGRFTFNTIRPGPYPNRRVPAHVHFTTFTPSGERFHAGEVKFENDPLLSKRDREEASQRGELGEVRPVRREGDAEHVAFTLRIDPAQRF